MFSILNYVSCRDQRANSAMSQFSYLIVITWLDHVSIDISVVQVYQLTVIGSGTLCSVSSRSGEMANSAEQRETFLECSLCFENDELKRLPCHPGHIFCVKCLTKQLEITKVVKCSLCR